MLVAGAARAAGPAVWLGMDQQSLDAAYTQAALAARDFAALLKSEGKPVELLVGTDYNHFELAETLGSPHGVLGRAALRQIT